MEPPPKEQKPPLSSPLSALPTIIEWETVQQEHELAPFGEQELGVDLRDPTTRCHGCPGPSGR